MKPPVPLKWACGECGAELLPLGQNAFVCNAYFCEARGKWLLAVDYQKLEDLAADDALSNLNLVADSI